MIYKNENYFHALNASIINDKNFKIMLIAERKLSKIINLNITKYWHFDIVVKLSLLKKIKKKCLIYLLL